MPNTTVPAAAPGLPSINRRTFLRGAAPAAAFAVAAAPASAAVTPEERARRAWAEFSDAMRDLVADGEGWMIVAGDRTASPDGAYMTLTRTHRFADPQYPSVTLEGLETINL